MVLGEHWEIFPDLLSGPPSVGGSVKHKSLEMKVKTIDGQNVSYIINCLSLKKNTAKLCQNSEIIIVRTLLTINILDNVYIIKGDLPLVPGGVMVMIQSSSQVLGWCPLEWVVGLVHQSQHFLLVGQYPVGE